MLVMWQIDKIWSPLSKDLRSWIMIYGANLREGVQKANTFDFLFFLSKYNLGCHYFFKNLKVGGPVLKCNLYGMVVEKN